MAKLSSTSTFTSHVHRDGHVMGNRPKRTSIGEGQRKRGSYRGSKAYRGQGK